MAGIPDSIRKAIQDFDVGDYEFAMMHACNAVDGTSAKLHPKIKAHSLRFTQTIRDNYDILGPLGVSGIDLINTRWPVSIKGARPENTAPDIADIIYKIHRCTHGHGDELPDGFDLIREANLGSNIVSTHIRQGSVRISDCTIFALLAIAVLSPTNAKLRIIGDYYLTFAGQNFMINDWWGRKADFIPFTKVFNSPALNMKFDNLKKV